MCWLAGVGVAVASIVGAEVAGTMAAAVIGGIVVGAVVGAVYAGITGGNILQGMLYGAIGGAVVGGVGYAMGFGAAAGTTGGSSGAGAIGGKTAVEYGTTKTAGLFATETMANSTSAAAFGSSLNSSIAGPALMAGAEMLKGGLSKAPEVDKDWEREKMDREADLNLQVANIKSGDSAYAVDSQYQTAAEQLAFQKEKFREEFDESKRQFDVQRDDELSAKDRFNQSVAAAGDYAAGTAQSASLVEINRQRKELAAPLWLQTKGANATVAASGGQRTGGLLASAMA